MATIADYLVVTDIPNTIKQGENKVLGGSYE